MYDLEAFLKEERGGDYVLGELLMLCATREPPRETSFNSALVFHDPDRDVFRFGHDVDLDKEFELTRGELRRLVKLAISQDE